MKIGISSQNFRTITGHAGKGRRFIIFTAENEDSVHETEKLDLPVEMSMHEWGYAGKHPLFELDYLITGSCGEGFIRKMAHHGIQVKVTSETDPLAAVKAFLAGHLPSMDSSHHEHHPYTHAFLTENQEEG